MNNRKIKRCIIMMAIMCLSVICISTKGVKAENKTTGTTKDNGTMIQYFEWYMANDGNLWNNLANDAKSLSDTGFTAVWMPPAYKGTSSSDVGYGPYDLYDLGEFKQKGTVRTKYGTKSQYLNAINSIHKNGMQAYADIVLNHKAGADECEQVSAQKVSGNNRNNIESGTYNIGAWTKFNFAGRGNKYSSFKWNASCFDGVDYDNNNKQNAIYKFSDKNWDWQVDSDNGNYDYLMYADVDFDNADVVNELKTWGKWYVDTADLDGFRLDAVKHIKFSFYKDWLTNLRKQTNKELFSVGEYWSGDIDKLNNYINETSGTTSLFDVPLHYNLYRASKNSGGYDMRNILEGTLIESNPILAVTFVDNHDSEPGQSLESYIEDWFKPSAYTLILTRQEGYPCVFYGDYYGINRNGGTNASGKSIKTVIDKLMIARTECAYGHQNNYFDNSDVVGWTREGDSNHTDSGLAALITDGASGSKKMYVGKQHAGEVWGDITGHQTANVTIDSQGYATFKVSAKSNSVYVNKNKLPIQINKAAVSIAKTDYCYTGKKIKPAVTVKYNGKTVSASNYTVSFSKNISIGKATIKITGKNKGVGTAYVTFNIVPPKVAGIKASSVTASSFKLSWTKTTGTVSGYRVYSYDTKTKKYKYIADINDGSKTYYLSKNRTSATVYKYYIRAYKKVGNIFYVGPASAVYTVCTAPAKVNFRLSSTRRNAIVKWNKVSRTSGYVVYYKTSTKASWKKLSTLSASRTSYVKSGLKKGKTYYFKVVAYKKNGQTTSYGTFSTKSVKVK